MAETSLIPKKFSVPRPMAAGEGFGAFFRIGLIVFLAAAVFTGGLYFYRNFLENSLISQKSILEKLEVEFEPSLIAELERVSNAIIAARDILRLHGKATPIFENILEKNTLAAVNFSTFAYSAEKNTITLGGEAASYADVASQSGVFEALPDVLSATFSNLSLRESGTIGFNLNIVLKK